MNENILLVEDEQALRMTLSDRLQGEGYVVDLSPDGEQGFEKATTLPFDLIILDIMLPRRSGLDICRDIRLAGLATPILLLTARGQITDKVVGLKLGADDYVTKPFDTLELIARIGPPRGPATAFSNLAQSVSIFVALRLREKAVPFIFLLGNFSSCAISQSTKGSPFLVMKSCARCGATRLARSRGPLMCTSPACARNWKRLPKNLR